MISNVHVWALTPRPGNTTTCSKLIGGEDDPYDVIFQRLADWVGLGSDSAFTASDAQIGQAFVYVEAVNYRGLPEVAGCQQIQIVQPSTVVTVELDKAGVFDCSAPETEDGAPCDDGQICTEGDKCQGGVCESGSARNCGVVADACKAGNCDEQLGCVAVPLSDGTPCDDELYCTVGESCQQGACTGTPRDCTSEATQCQTGGVCDELYDRCTFTPNTSAPCDDGNACTTGEYCSSSGTCTYGVTKSCSRYANDCNTGTCDPLTGECIRTPRTVGTSCYSRCVRTSASATVYGTCDSTGTCVFTTPVDATAVDCSGYTPPNSYPCYVTTCAEPYGCYAPPGTSGTCTTATYVCSGTGSCVAP
jgi:hypothetical protein